MPQTQGGYSDNGFTQPKTQVPSLYLADRHNPTCTQADAGYSYDFHTQPASQSFEPFSQPTGACKPTNHPTQHMLAHRPWRASSAGSATVCSEHARVTSCFVVLGESQPDWGPSQGAAHNLVSSAMGGPACAIGASAAKLVCSSCWELSLQRICTAGHPCLRRCGWQ